MVVANFVAPGAELLAGERNYLAWDKIISRGAKLFAGGENYLPWDKII